MDGALKPPVNWPRRNVELTLLSFTFVAPVKSIQGPVLLVPYWNLYVAPRVVVVVSHFKSYEIPARYVSPVAPPGDVITGLTGSCALYVVLIGS